MKIRKRLLLIELRVPLWIEEERAIGMVLRKEEIIRASI